MKKALITGGAGFIGLHLARRLAETGWSVDLLDNFSRGVRDPELAAFADSGAGRLIERDVLAPGALAGLDRDYSTVFHLAAIIGVANVLERPYAVLRDNTAMLACLIDWARGLGGLERFVFASTSEVYAGTLQHYGLAFPTPEATPLAVTDLEHPRSSYMLSKIYGEAMCRHSGLPITLVRPHNFYGPRMGMLHVVPQLLERAHRAKDGDTLDVYSVDHRRTFCHIADAVETIRLLAERPEGLGRVFNVGVAEPEVDMGALAALVVRTVGRDLKLNPLPATPGSPPRRQPDIALAAAASGYSPRVGLEEGVRLTYDWYRSRVFEGGGESAR